MPLHPAIVHVPLGLALGRAVGHAGGSLVYRDGAASAYAGASATPAGELRAAGADRDLRKRGAPFAVHRSSERLQEPGRLKTRASRAAHPSPNAHTLRTGATGARAILASRSARLAIHARAALAALRRSP